MMKQFARLKFSSFGLKVPMNWQTPSGDPEGSQYTNAFKPEERNTAPDTVMPPLFMPATMNKYHTDTQKMHNAEIGKFIDGITAAICSAWGQWQSMASMAGVIINALTASVGQVIGPPLTPLILAEAPKSKPSEAKYSQVIATVIGNAWLAYTATIKIPGLPWYPAFAAAPAPVAPPMPNIPTPVVALTQVTAMLEVPMMKMQMAAMLADPMAPFHKELFEAVCDGFDKCFKIWQASTMITNVMGTGPVPSWTPLSPAGPVVMGVGTMPPGGFK